MGPKHIQPYHVCSQIARCMEATLHKYMMVMIFGDLGSHELA